jgi:hypothetical protein
MSGKRLRTRVQHEKTVPSTTRRVLTDALGAQRATTVTGLSFIDEQLALSVVERRTRQKRRKHRCGICGLMYPPDELHHEFDEEGHRIGWVCDGCY